jgi:DNA repair exonuclease SbcCD nuclease subunit
MILLGGDLFHENTPSRSTVYRCVSQLGQHCAARLCALRATAVCRVWWLS